MFIRVNPWFNLLPFAHSSLCPLCLCGESGFLTNSRSVFIRANPRLPFFFSNHEPRSTNHLFSTGNWQPPTDNWIL